MLKTINFEDEAIKHSEIKRVLEDHRIPEHVWVESVEDGMEKIEEAAKAGIPFGLIITDMHYPVERRGESDAHAGEKLIEMLQEKELAIPVIVCSSQNYKIPGAYANVWYSEKNNWEWQLGQLIDQIIKERN